MMEAAKKKPEDLTPLAVDLDHTLLACDTLHEQIVKYVKKNPFRVFNLMFWILSGRKNLKARLAAKVDLEIETLPFNKEVYYYIKRMAIRDREMILVTGAHQSIADKIAKHLGIFSAAYGSTFEVNLVGKNKQKFLTNKFGSNGFDYIGDSAADLHVWQSARYATVVSDNSSFVRKVNKICKIEKVFHQKRSAGFVFIKALRLHQWSKNVLLIAPIMLAHKFDSLEAISKVFFGFFAFSFTASIVYIINDIFDLDSDRVHIDKKHRPIASGDLSIISALSLVPFLSIAAILCSLKVSIEFQFILFCYLIMTSLYTVFFKKFIFADVIVLSGLYSLRLFAGAVIVEVAISPWLMGFSGFFFLCLALIKRCSELELLPRKAPGRGYSTKELPILYSLASGSACSAIVILALYINSDFSHKEYENPIYMWFMCPLIFYWVGRVLILTSRGELDTDPVRFAITDNVTWLVFAAISGFWLLASYSF